MAQQNVSLPGLHELQMTTNYTQRSFYVVSTKKLTMLLLVTLGVYAFYWFYKNWQVAKVQNPKYAKSYPGLRALFAIIYSPSLFACIQKRAEQENIKLKLSAWHLAAASNLLIICSLVLFSLGSVYATLFGVLAALCAFLPILKMQKVINLIEHDPTGWANHKLTGLNWLCILTGASYTSLFALATVMLFAS